MEENQSSCSPNPSSSRHNVAVVKAKFKPKIRIIHLLAPEIIKTEVANFRDLVQQLTGKPAVRINGGGINKKPRSSPRKRVVVESSKREPNNTRSAELPNESGGNLLNGERIEEEEEEEEGEGEIWGSEGYSNELRDFEGFIAEIGGFPSLPLRSSRADVFDDLKLPY